MEIQVAVPETHVSAPVLDAALEAVTRLNESLIASGQAPPFGENVLDRVRWRPEPPGNEHFDHALKVLARGWGDCDDLAPWRAGSLRATGEDPGATAVVRKSGPSRWHAVVLRSDGSIDDPSRAAGMGAVHGIPPAATSPMYRATGTSVAGVYEVRPALAVRPTSLGWQARADLPWAGTDYAMTALHYAPVASQAITGAIAGIHLLAEAAGFADPSDNAALVAVGALLDGHHPRDVASVVGRASVRRAMHVMRTIRPMIGMDIVPASSYYMPHLAAVELPSR